MNINHLQGLDLNLLPSLMVLLEERHITNAATRLNKTQSAMSHTLRKLRDVFQDELLVRSGNEMYLTPLAEALRPELHRMLSDLELMLRPQEELNPAELKRHFYIAATEMTELIILSRLLPTLSKLAPGVHIQTRYAEHRAGESIEQRLRDGEFDLAWTVVFEDVAGIIAQRLYTERLVCVLAPQSPWLDADGVLTLERFVSARHVLISPRGKRGGFMDNALAALGLEREVVWMTGSFLSAPLLTSMTELILTMPEQVALALIKTGIQLKIVDPPLELPTFSVVMAYHERFKNDAGHRWLREQVLRAFDVAPTLEP